MGTMRIRPEQGRHPPHMNIDIFDHRLTARTGHHFDFCHGMAKGLEQMGYAVGVYGHQGAEPDVAESFRKIRCSFGGLFSLFDHPIPGPNALPGPELDQLALEIAAEIDRLPPAALHLFPTLTPEHLLAYSFSTRSTPLLGVVHVEPNFRHPFGNQIWARACERIHQRGLPATIGAMDPVLGDVLRTYSGPLPISELPVPIGAPSRSAAASVARTIGFFGHQRGERGKILLPMLIQQLVAKGYNVVFHDTRAQFDDIAPDPRIRLLPFVDNLDAEMAKCDLVVCLMDPQKYAMRLSGIACHAVAGGLPILLPAGTLSAVRFRPLGSAAFYCEPSVEGVLNAIADMASHYPPYAESAIRAAPLWNRQNGIEPFIQHIQSLLKA